MRASVYIVDINKHISGCVCVLKGWVYLREPEEVVAGKYRNPPFVGAGIRFGSSAYTRERRWGTTLYAVLMQVPRHALILRITSFKSV
jgi:hypothetical protein